MSMIRGIWTEGEDRFLRNLVAEHGVKDWGRVASFFHHRTAKQCRERFCNILDPTLKRTPFTEVDDAVLKYLQGQLGNRWTRIAQEMPGRSENECKNRWHSAAFKRSMLGLSSELRSHIRTGEIAKLTVSGSRSFDDTQSSGLQLAMLHAPLPSPSRATAMKTDSAEDEDFTDTEDTTSGYSIPISSSTFSHLPPLNHMFEAPSQAPKTTPRGRPTTATLPSDSSLNSTEAFGPPLTITFTPIRKCGNMPESDHSTVEGVRFDPAGWAIWHECTGNEECSCSDCEERHTEHQYMTDIPTVSLLRGFSDLSISISSRSQSSNSIQRTTTSSPDFDTPSELLIRVPITTHSSTTSLGSIDINISRTSPISHDSLEDLDSVVDMLTALSSDDADSDRSSKR